jgi:hypothetical protein
MELSGSSSCVRSGAGCAAAFAMPALLLAPEGAAIAYLFEEVFLRT